MSTRIKDDARSQEEATEWLTLVLAAVTAVALTVIYFMLPTGAHENRLLSFAESCIPNIVTALVVFTALYLVLGRVGLRTEDRIIRRVEQVIAGGETEGLTFNDVSGMSNMVHDIVSEIPKKEIVRLEILGFAGGTFTTDLLRDLLRLEDRRFQLTLRVIDFSKAQKDIMPPHWEQEEEETLRRLPLICSDRVDLQIWLYPTLPFMLGLLVGGSHVFIAFPPWDRASGKLADKSLEYRYYVRSNGTDHIFRLFDNWANQPRQVKFEAAGAE